MVWWLSAGPAPGSTGNSDRPRNRVDLSIPPRSVEQAESEAESSENIVADGGTRDLEWGHWRGPLQTGVSLDQGLPESWSQDGDNLVWSQPFGGRSCPVVVDGRVCIIGVVGDDNISTQERVVCFDAENGQKLWEHRFNVFHSTIVANRVGWANLAGDPETGYVYAHGVQDLLICFDPEGRIVWSHSMKEKFGSVTGYGGRIHTPVIDEDRLIISFLSSSWGKQGRPLHRYLALDKTTGEVHRRHHVTADGFYKGNKVLDLGDE